MNRILSLLPWTLLTRFWPHLPSPTMTASIMFVCFLSVRAQRTHACLSQEFGDNLTRRCGEAQEIYSSGVEHGAEHEQDTCGSSADRHDTRSRLTSAARLRTSSAEA